jgi:hypothetical protein
VTPQGVRDGAKLNRQIGMYFKFFILYGFPEDTVRDHRLTEDLIAETRCDAVCCSILQPIPGTEVYEQLKPYLIRDVAEMDFHYWYATESYKHPIFTHDELRSDREKLLQVHRDATINLRARALRKLERFSAMVRHPELIADWFEFRGRRRRYRQRVNAGEWKTVFDRTARSTRQVPNYGSPVKNRALRRAQ